MPLYLPVESLKHMCFVTFAKVIHNIAVDIEENKTPHFMEKSCLNRVTFNLPSIFVEQMIVKVIETIHNNVRRNRRTVGLQTCVEVLLQPHILRLDMSGLFFKMRLPVQINSTIRQIVCAKVAQMEKLTSINLVSKCDDEILQAISQHCPNITVIIISLSDLVSDKGIITVCKACHSLERLEIYKCWGVSPAGVKGALINAKNLKELHSDDLGNVFLHHLKKTKQLFKLRHFEQTHSTFEPKFEDSEWIGKICPDIQSVRLYMDDEFLHSLPKLGTLRTVELELTSYIGEGFTSSVAQVGSTLTTLHLSCETINQEHLLLVGRECKQLSSFHITTATIEDDKNMKNNGEYFSNLTSLHLQVWKETCISAECIDFFLLWCRQLTNIVIKAQMEFFTDLYLQRILETNPLQHANKINITSDKFVPLTVRSVNYLLQQCPNLEYLTVSSWDVSEDEFFQLMSLIKENNYNFFIT